MRPQKGTSLGKTVLFEPLRIKVGSVVWYVGLVTKQKKGKVYMLIFHLYGELPLPIRL
jgi:hypothetical protein